MGCIDLSWEPTWSRAAWALPVRQVLLGDKAASSGSFVPPLGREEQPLPRPWFCRCCFEAELPIHGNAPAGS